MSALSGDSTLIDAILGDTGPAFVPVPAQGRYIRNEPRRFAVAEAFVPVALIEASGPKPCFAH